MAEVNLYPISDVSLKHSCSTGSQGYPLINDPADSPDDDSAYIYLSVQGAYQETVSSSATSTFKVSESDIDRKIYLQSLTAHIRHCSSSSSLTGGTLGSISINGGTKKKGTFTTGSTSWNTYTQTFSNVTGYNTIYNSFSDANIVLELVSSAVTSSKSSYKFRTTQAYVTATYLPIYNFEAINKEGCTSVSVSVNEAKEGDSVTFTATKSSEYTFIGWFSDFECTQLVSQELTYTTAASEDLTLYAFASLVYQVNAYGDDYSTVSISPSSTGVAGTEITVTCTPIDSMKEFVGWYSNASRTTLVSTSNPYVFSLTGDTTLYAKCKLKYIMYVKLNGQWIVCSKVFKKIDSVWVEQENLSGLFDTSKNYKKEDV